jgi:hypothetical protein
MASPRAKAARVIGKAAIAAAFIVTLAANCFTISHILHGSTRVPWRDEWAIIHDFMRYKRGGAIWPILWSSYWGHRFVIPRLVCFANLQWAAQAPLTWLTFTFQTVWIALLCALSWLLIGRRSRILFAVAVTVILNLALFPLQMENFVWSMQFMVPLVYAASGICFVCLALHKYTARSIFVAGAFVAAAVVSYTMANGLFVWPVLVAQAIYLRLDRRLTIAIALLGIGVIVSYCWHYQAAPLGMGMFGMLRKPVDATMLVGLLLGGALNSISLRLSIAVTIMALVGAVCMGVRVLRERPAEQLWLSALAGIIVFLFLSAVSTVAGRMAPFWLADNTAVPSRYFTLIQDFWAALAILVLYTLCRMRRPALFACSYGAFYVCLMFLNPQRQESAAEDWADFFRGADAVGAAFLVDAPDEKLLSLLWPIKPERDEIVTFMRQGRLSVFAERRAAWQGRQVSGLFPLARTDRCIGGIERSLPLTDQPAEGPWRIEGWSWNASNNREFDYLLIANPAGLVVGMARGGFRHRYFPGFFTDAPPAWVPHMRFHASEWLGYVRQSAKTPWIVYGILPHMDGVCIVRD